jgi:hypothetical protein
MKIKPFHIFCLLLAGFVFCFDTCSTVDTEAENIVNVDQDSVVQGIMKDFSADYLVDEQLLIFGEKGKEKIRDLFDFLNLYSDQNIDPVFRDEIRAAMFNCFSDKNAPVNIWPVVTAYPTGISVWLSSLKMTGFTGIRYEPAELKIVEPLRMVTPERYNGQIKCTVTITALSGSDTIHSESTVKQVGMEVIKISKSFGPETHEVWQVFLTGIN